MTHKVNRGSERNYKRGFFRFQDRKAVEIKSRVYFTLDNKTGGNIEMSNEDQIGFQEVILKKYEIESGYHDTKTKMAWTAGSVYFAFTVALFVFLVRLEDPLPCKGFLAAILVAIYICTLSYISLQFLGRWESNRRVGFWLWTFGKSWESMNKSSNYADLEKQYEKAMEYEEKGRIKTTIDKRRHWCIFWLTPFFFILLLILFARGKKKIVVDGKEQDRWKFHIPSEYWSEIPIYCLMTWFLTGQILMLCKLG